MKNFLKMCVAASLLAVSGVSFASDVSANNHELQITSAKNIADRETGKPLDGYSTILSVEHNPALPNLLLIRSKATLIKILFDSFDDAHKIKEALESNTERLWLSADWSRSGTDLDAQYFFPKIIWVFSSKTNRSIRLDDAYLLGIHEGGT